MERIDVVDRQLKFIRKGYRGEYLNQGEFMKFVHIWVVNNGKILIQKRSHDRKWAPGMWATHTGVVGEGEHEAVCASRELNEELGIDIAHHKFDLGFITSPTKRFRGIGFIYFVEAVDVDITIDNEEVIDYKYVDIDSLMEMIENNEFIHYGNDGLEYENYFEKVFEKIQNMMEG